jgi:hypothetical protein
MIILTDLKAGNGRKAVANIVDTILKAGAVV